ncbi:nitrogen regulation protein NR(II) [Fretibacter rubidus]|uniref:two-component system sensor histidine kinase NtrB n=1 Tax=Fretibacter rubidus TaxID=570162 RepID=UPI00352A2607
MSDLDLNLLLDDIPSPIFVFNPNSLDIAWVNMESQDWVGHSAKAIIGTSLSEHLSPCEPIIEAAKRCVISRGAVSLRGYILARTNMADERVHLTLFPSGGFVGMIVSLAAAQPNETAANDIAVSAMGRMLAHEIKNPLAGINGAAQLLRDDVKTDEGQKLIDLIGSEINRIRRLADRMETLGDRNPENLSLVNIHEILRDARKLMQATVSSNIVFTEDYDPSLPETLGDRDTLMQALLNLIKNAAEVLEHGGQGGEITLRTSFRSGVVRKGFSGRPDQGLPIEIRISDDGPGIPPEIREQIFQPFVTDKPSGQGLGLALVAKVAAAHDGLIELKSRPGRTVFSLLLPGLTLTDLADGANDEI